MSSRVSHDAEQYPAVHTPAAQSLSVMIKRELISAPIHPNLKYTYIYIYDSGFSGSWSPWNFLESGKIHYNSVSPRVVLGLNATDKTPLNVTQLNF